ncbi:hypothetical protein PsorP6_013957 [Peronosclerospora sorghi]|uniref:Uncharacterized protein n=1 Tax=Peronosclerospora sorghi TaxID=230839 RepID=A0ACC0VHW8_9STRA|nr:hypothetical protein PsorP6_013957 [Peronosclerospora sorghi]
MKPFQLVLTLLLAATSCGSGVATSTSDFEWTPEVDVEIPADQSAGVHAPNALRRMQATTNVLSTESGSLSSVANDAASAAGLTTDTDEPATIMVLLPDNLAMSSSGSGSVMVYDGDVGTKTKKENEAADSDTEASSAMSLEMMTAMTAVTMLFACGMV